MFKRVEKRRRKREEEEELGLDEDMKQVLGMNDTDSEESASDSDDDFGSDGAEGSGSEGNQDLDEQDRLFEQQVQEEEGREKAELPAMTVQEALRDPVYIISLEPSVRGCIVCSGKILKSTKMIELHKASNAHQRRVKQFAALVSGANSQTNAWDILAQQEAMKSEKQSLDMPSETSNRAQKRKSRAMLRKMRRKKQKAFAQAKKLATVLDEPTRTASPVAEPSKKKQKVAESTSSAPSTVGPSQTPRENKSIAAIARSASVRAKAARTKAAVKSKPDSTIAS